MTQPLSHDAQPATDLIQDSLDTLEEFASLLSRSAGLPHEVYGDLYGDFIAQQTLSAEAALREITNFPCSDGRNDELLVEVMRDGQMNSSHLYRLPLSAPLQLPLQPGDTVLSFHDHTCNRHGALSRQQEKARCFLHANNFLKVIAIE